MPIEHAAKPFHVLSIEYSIAFKLLRRNRTAPESIGTGVMSKIFERFEIHAGTNAPTVLRGK